MIVKEIKERARELRRLGWTYAEIKRILGVKTPKSTFSHWFRDIQMPESYFQRVDLINYENIVKARERAKEANKKKRNDLLTGKEDGILKQIEENQISPFIKKIALSMLYFGEGSKWCRGGGMRLGSSDPEMMKMYVNLLKELYGIPRDMLKCKLAYRCDQNHEELKKYWSAVLDIPLKNFYNSKPDPRTIGKITKIKSYKGVCAVYGGTTEIQIELEMIPHLLFLEKRNESVWGPIFQR